MTGFFETLAVRDTRSASDPDPPVRRRQFARGTSRSLQLKNKSRLLAGMVLGVAIGLVAALTLEPVNRSLNIGEGAQAAPHPLQLIDASVAAIKSGTPRFRLSKLWVSPDGRTTTGVWAADGPSTFVVDYSVDETVYVLDGGAEIDYQGQRIALQPGMTAHFGKGTSASWHVPTSIRKVYEVQRPNRATRWWNQLFHPTESAGAL